jgi:hypothetical protein
MTIRSLREAFRLGTSIAFFLPGIVLTEGAAAEKRGRCSPGKRTRRTNFLSRCFAVFLLSPRRNTLSFPALTEDASPRRARGGDSLRPR